MKGSRGVVAWLALALLLEGVVMSAGGCERNPLDETPPFKGGMGVPVELLYEDYAADEAKANKRYKGKILGLSDANLYGSLDAAGGPCGPPRVDSAGDKYMAVVLPDPAAPARKREVVRCYLHEGKAFVFGQGDETVVVGICMGKVDGVIVLRKCYYLHGGGGAAW